MSGDETTVANIFADAGYRTYLTRFPDQDFSVVVFSNSAAFNSGGIAHKVVDIYLEDLIEDEPKKDIKKEETAEEETQASTFVVSFVFIIPVLGIMYYFQEAWAQRERLELLDRRNRVRS